VQAPVELGLDAFGGADDAGQIPQLVRRCGGVDVAGFADQVEQQCRVGVAEQLAENGGADRGLGAGDDFAAPRESLDGHHGAGPGDQRGGGERGEVGPLCAAGAGEGAFLVQFRVGGRGEGRLRSLGDPCGECFVLVLGRGLVRGCVRVAGEERGVD
jgi:hypothetical protein